MTDKGKSLVKKNDASKPKLNRKISWGEVRVTEYFRANKDTEQVEAEDPSEAHKSSTHHALDQYEDYKNAKPQEEKLTNISFSEVDLFNNSAQDIRNNEIPQKNTGKEQQRVPNKEATSGKTEKQLFFHMLDNNDDSLNDLINQKSDEKMQVDHQNGSANSASNKQVKFDEVLEVDKPSVRKNTGTYKTILKHNENAKDAILLHTPEISLSTPKNYENSKLSSSVSPVDKPAFVHEFNQKRRLKLQENSQEAIEKQKPSLDGSSLINELNSDNCNNDNVTKLIKDGNIDTRLLSDKAMKKLLECHNLVNISHLISSEDCTDISDSEITKYQVNISELKSKLTDYYHNKLRQNAAIVKAHIKDTVARYKNCEEIEAEVKKMKQEIQEIDNTKVVTIEECNESVAAKLSANSKTSIMLQELNAIAYITGWRISNFETFIQEKTLNLSCIPFGIMLHITYRDQIDLKTLRNGNR